jgi:hypothetical protein
MLLEVVKLIALLAVFILLISLVVYNVYFIAILAIFGAALHFWGAYSMCRPFKSKNVESRSNIDNKRKRENECNKGSNYEIHKIPGWVKNINDKSFDEDMLHEIHTITSENLDLNMNIDSAIKMASAKYMYKQYPQYYYARPDIKFELSSIKTIRH